MPGTVAMFITSPPLTERTAIAFRYFGLELPAITPAAVIPCGVAHAESIGANNAMTTVIFW